MNTSNAKLGSDSDPFSIDDKLISYNLTLKPTSKENIQNCQMNENYLYHKYIDLTIQYSIVRIHTTKEDDSKHVPHIHGMIYASSNLFIKPSKGWHIYLQKNYDNNFSNYMNKDYRKEQNELRNFYENSYQFIDNKHISPYKLDLNLS